MPGAHLGPWSVHLSVTTQWSRPHSKRALSPTSRRNRTETERKQSRTLYAFALKWPGETLLLRTIPPREAMTIRMLGTTEPLTWKPANGATQIHLPPGLQDESRRPCPYAWAFEIRSADSPVLS